MGDKIEKRYNMLYDCYLKNEDAYWWWATMIKQWKIKVRNNDYYKTFPGKTKKQKQKRIDAVLEDYPFASLRDICASTKLSQQTVREYRQMKFVDAPFYYDAPVPYCWSVYDSFRRDPDCIYDAR